MLSFEDAIIELIYIIQSITNINKQKIFLLFSFIYKASFICFNCIKFIKIISSHILYLSCFISNFILLCYDIQSINSYDFKSSSSLYNSSNNIYPLLLFGIFFIIIIISLLISLNNHYQ